MLNNKNPFGLILSNSERSFHYLKYLNKKKFIPSTILVYSKNKITSQLNKQLINRNFTIIYNNNINCKAIEKKILNSPEKHFLFSGYPAQIIQNKKLLKKKIIFHSHSGKLPYYKGSTTIFYSILNENSICCSTFRMNDQLDNGNIYLVKKYNFNKKIFKKFNEFDNLIRIKNFCTVLKRNFSINNSSVKKNKYNNYYIAHPIIRCLSKLSQKN